MKAEITAILKLNNKIFGSLTEDKTKLDVLQQLSWMIREGKGIEEIFIKDFKLMEMEK